LPKVPVWLVVALLAPLVVAGCTAPAFIGFPPQVRGNLVSERELAQLIPGTSKRADVSALLGSPTAHATFDDNTWLYIGEDTKPQIAGTNAVLSQEVVEVHFDQQGVLRSIERKTQKNAVPVSMASRVTPTPGVKTSFLQQLLGNIGKFNPVANQQENAPNGGVPSNGF
jgi:outer membrane protein assembly factor BamE (lipoprotein component of BamABCDE complex)